MMAIEKVSSRSVEKWIGDYKGGCPETFCLEMVGSCNDYNSCEDCLIKALTREISTVEGRVDERT